MIRRIAGMPTPAEYRKHIEGLVNRFENHRQLYLAPSPLTVKGKTYNETELRREFVDRVFWCLGWDVNNDKGYSEAYKDVVHEDPIKVRGKLDVIDYSFRIGGIRKFIVETKRPSVRIKDNKEWALQLRRYAWNAKLPLNILTNFDEWAIYDCTKKPELSDTVATGRLAYFTYDKLLEKWDDLVEIFSQERILQGSFDRYVIATKGKRGTISVDKDFLATIEKWRDELARNLANWNGALSVEDLNIAVQLIIDRIIFLRIAEDRGLEKDETLKKLLDGDGVYARLCEIFRRADDRYNSGLFHFSEETGWDEVPDRLTLGLNVDDKVLKGIIKQLYYPDSPYEFSAIPPVILGQVYEQFLGKVIRLTPGHRAKVEDKPEVKKAGGVFYTPVQIVDYIVRETVGRLVEGKTPAEVAALRILDPACGSGSFLLGAYQFLLDWHLDWYIAHLVPVLNERSASDPDVLALLPKVKIPAKRGKKAELRPIDLPIYKAGKRKEEKGKESGSDWQLKTAERKRILLNNLFGVDIDQQAVEVTKLSLLLKVLEEETGETITGQLTLGTERALPSLHRNIRCGNSLVSSDVLAAGGLTQEDVARINPFDWERGFPEIMQAGGFDAVIGNPPWGASVTDEVETFIRKHYAVAKGRSYDTYSLFIEKALNLSKRGGLVSYIIPDTCLRKDDHLETRRLLFEDACVNELIETGPVFSEVRDTWALVFRLCKDSPTSDSIVTHKKINRFIVSAEERLEKFGSRNWDSIGAVPQQLWQERPMMIVGYLTSTEAQRIIEKIEKYPSLEDQEDMFRVSRGEEGSKFNIKGSEHGDFFMVIPQDISRYARQDGVRVESQALAENKKNDFYSHPKIWIIRIQKMRWRQRLVATLDDRVNSCGMKTLQTIVSKSDNEADLKYLLGIISSKMTNYRCINYLSDDMNKSYLLRLPIRPIDSSNPDDMAKRDRIAGLVDKMLDLNRRLPAAATEHEKQLISLQIGQADRAIDTLIYDLYGLTPEEIAIVEQGIY